MLHASLRVELCNKRVGDFNFVRHYGAEVKEIKRSGVSIVDNLSRVKFREGDTLVLWADDSFISTWRKDCSLAHPRYPLHDNPRLTSQKCCCKGY